MEQTKTKRIVIEIEEEDYETLTMMKDLLNLTWRDFLIAGAVFWNKEFKVFDKIEELKAKLEEFLKD